MVVFSKPMVFVFGFLPTETRTCSNFFVVVSPSFSIVTIKPFGFEGFTSTIFVDKCISLKCFFNFLAKGLTRSGSAPGSKFGKNSAMLTSAPRALKTVPISRPIYPPPITNRFFGIFSISSAVLEVRTFLLSNGIPGILDDDDPAAINPHFF